MKGDKMQQFIWEAHGKFRGTLLEKAPDKGEANVISKRAAKSFPVFVQGPTQEAVANALRALAI